MTDDKPSAVDRAISILRSRYHESSLSAAAVSRTLKMSERHFRRTLKQRTGLSFTQHRRYVRMRKAADLLIASSDEIKVVSAAVGYDYQSHFAKDFRRYWGCTPREFRITRVQRVQAAP